MKTSSSRRPLVAAFLLGAAFAALVLTVVHYYSPIGVAHAQTAAGCSNASLDGSFGIHVDGEVLAMADGTPLANPVPVDAVGVTTADGAGNTSGIDTVDLDGKVRPGGGTGTYSVNANCTFTLMHALTTASGANITLHLTGVIVDGGKKAYLIDADTGLADIHVTLEKL